MAMVINWRSTYCCASFFTLWAVSTRQSVIEVRVDGVEDADESDKVVCYFIEPNFQLRWIHSVENSGGRNSIFAKAMGYC